LKALNGTQFEYFCRDFLQLVLSAKGDKYKHRLPFPQHVSQFDDIFVLAAPSVPTGPAKFYDVKITVWKKKIFIT
jgi:hypothetical protein